MFWAQFVLMTWQFWISAWLSDLVVLWWSISAINIPNITTTFGLCLVGSIYCSYLTGSPKNKPLRFMSHVFPAKCPGCCPANSVEAELILMKLCACYFLWSPYVIGQTVIFLPCYFYLLLFILLLLLFIPRLISAAAGWMSTILWHMVWP